MIKGIFCLNIIPRFPRIKEKDKAPIKNKKPDALTR
jgi:hypothetical protein